MPIPFSITAISGTFPDMAVCYYEKTFIILIGIFYPLGEPILQGGVGWRLHRSPFVVVHYSFMGRFLAIAAILTRE
jgi:amino acid permease